LKLDEIINNTHNTFGGLVFPSDFNTETGRGVNSVSWADRVASDIKFDKQCQKNYETRKRNKELEQEKEYA
jgi:hypothetical protein